MKNKTVSQLEIIAKDHAFNSPEKRHEALVELEERNALSDECRKLKKTFEESVEDEKTKARYSHRKDNPDLTTDEAAPLLYSRRAVYLFTILFSTIAGAFMLARNLKEKNKERIGILVIIFGFAFAILLGYSATLLGENSSLIAGFNALFSIPLIELIWNRYIGKNIKYRKRSIAIPLIFWLVLWLVIIFLIFYLPGLEF